MTLHTLPGDGKWIGLTRLTINGRTFARPGTGPDAEADLRALAAMRALDGTLGPINTQENG